MAKGSVRKKGKKWYGRFYIEDESGRKVQKEFAGTDSKAETEAMLRKAIADYEEKAVCRESGKHHGRRYAGYVGRGRTETRQLKQRDGHVLSGNGQPYQAISHWQTQAENSDRRPFAGVH